MDPGLLILLVILVIGAILYATDNLDFITDLFKDDDAGGSFSGPRSDDDDDDDGDDEDPDPDAPSKGHKVRITHVDADKLINLSQVEVYDSSDTNVASGKPVTGLPGVWPGNYGFANLVDGTSAVAHTRGTGVHSMTIDLEKETEIEAIVITNRVDCSGCRPRSIGIRVEILDDDDKVIKRTQQITKNAKKYTYDFTATNPEWEYTDEEVVPIRGHKVRITHVDADKIINLGQVEVYDSGGTNVSRGKPVTGLPGAWPSFSFSSLVDGDKETTAHTQGTGIHSMTIDLEKEIRIGSVIISNRIEGLGWGRAVGLRVEILDANDKVITRTPQITENVMTYTYDFSDSLSSEIKKNAGSSWTTSS